MNRLKPSDPAPAETDDMGQRIVRAAFQTFSEKGYAGASTLLIATRAKVSKRDLYAMFPSKEAMLLACITTHSERMRMPEGLPEPEDRQMLAAALEAFAANFLGETLNPDVIGMHRLAIAEAIRSPEVAQMLEEAREANRAILYELFVRAQGKGLLPSGDTAEMVRKYLALVLEDLILSLLLGVLPQPSRAQIQRHATRAAVDFLLLYPSPGQST
ncbi:TetR/AcrR family transcriptional regulator [Phenylobacterium montanum]|uniref:TetR/AcrR family transcriptional regulator n=1 Tax=Phenylobacterium montanum TaxID=2823693 RepID=A0A975G1X5_9CAUL|nr:TetR/AcrR family transcriptional regulator [Caulobacter sp. S6]QUD89615.1 TetR/AcrR family transcriptional regulator [Caulobacter sp. S6]